MSDLSRAMAYKNALAGPDHGGGKAVIIGDPATLKSEALLRAYGRFIESLSGRYITACDIGTYSEDMDIIARECGYVVGRQSNGGAGDSSVLTAFGVFQGMRAAAQHRWGQPSLEGRLVGVEGVGKVGRRLVDSPGRGRGGRRRVRRGSGRGQPGGGRTSGRPGGGQPGRPAQPRPGRGTRRARSVAPDDDTAATLRASIVCGGANNQLAHPGIEKLLADRGVLYAPDYVVNAGGVIQVADERSGFNFERAQARAEQFFGTTRQIFALAGHRGQYSPRSRPTAWRNAGCPR